MLCERGQGLKKKSDVSCLQLFSFFFSSSAQENHRGVAGIETQERFKCFFFFVFFYRCHFCHSNSHLERQSKIHTSLDRGLKHRSECGETVVRSVPQFLHPTSQNGWERGNVVVCIFLILYIEEVRGFWIINVAFLLQLFLWLYFKFVWNCISWQ